MRNQRKEGRRDGVAGVQEQSSEGDRIGIGRVGIDETGEEVEAGVVGWEHFRGRENGVVEGWRSVGTNDI